MRQACLDTFPVQTPPSVMEPVPAELLNPIGRPSAPNGIDISAGTFKIHVTESTSMELLGNVLKVMAHAEWCDLFQRSLHHLWVYGSKIWYRPAGGYHLFLFWESAIYAGYALPVLRKENRPDQRSCVGKWRFSTLVQEAGWQPLSMAAYRWWSPKTYAAAIPMVDGRTDDWSEEIRQTSGTWILGIGLCKTENYFSRFQCLKMTACVYSGHCGSICFGKYGRFQGDCFHKKACKTVRCKKRLCI